MQVLRYLGRYTHRVAISNHRLLEFDGEHVAFRWKDYAHGGKQRKMTLAATEFLRRFFLHVLPKRFVRIRRFGFLANRFHASQLAQCRQLVGMDLLLPAESVPSGASRSTWHCPHCMVAWKPVSANPVVAWLNVALVQLVVVWHRVQSWGNPADL